MGRIYARRAHTSWCEAVDKICVGNAQVLRIEPDKNQILYYDSSDGKETLGVLDWGEGTIWSVPVWEYVPAFAFYKERLFLMYEHEVHAINQHGQVETIYTAPKGFYCCGLDTIPSHNMHPAALVIACSSWLTPKHSQILVYKLDD